MYTKYILVLFSFFVLSSSAYAEHEGANKETIKALVEKVKKAEPSQRRLLMNELKTKLRTMHQATRTQVMLDLRRSFNSQQRGQQGNRAIESNMHHQDTMSMTESKHMQEHMTESTMGGAMSPTQKPPEGSRPPVKRPPVNRPNTGSTTSTQKPNMPPMRGM